MPQQRDEESARIAAHHLRRLTDAEQTIIAARSRNRHAEEIGELVGLSARQVERLIVRLTDLIVVPLGYDSHGWLPGEWASVHAECCLAEGWNVLRKAG